MAKVALTHLIWHSDPVLDADGNAVLRKVTGVVTQEPDVIRVNLRSGMTVPSTVPQTVQDEWLAKGWVREDPDAREPAAPLPEVLFSPGILPPVKRKKP